MRRARKVELYTDFVVGAHEIKTALAEVGLGMRADTEMIREKTRTLYRLSHTLRVLSPGLVYKAAQDVISALGETTKSLVLVLEKSSEGQKAYDGAVEDFQDKVTLLELRFTDDLGIEWAV